MRWDESCFLNLLPRERGCWFVTALSTACASLSPHCRLLVRLNLLRHPVPPNCIVPVCANPAGPPSAADEASPSSQFGVSAGVYPGP